LLEALGVVGNVDLFLGNDTGLTHYAARFGVPTIGIFSGIDPTATWAPVGEGTTVLKAPVPCSPCHILHLEDCRNNHECMNGISVAAVKRAIRAALLKRAPWRNGTGVPPHPRDRGAAV
jgi:ADP-heptose:LPS heptosyltransferase